MSKFILAISNSVARTSLTGTTSLDSNIDFTVGSYAENKVFDTYDEAIKAWKHRKANLIANCKNSCSRKGPWTVIEEDNEEGKWAVRAVRTTGGNRTERLYFAAIVRVD